MKGRLLLIEPLPAGGHAALLMVDGRVEDFLTDAGTTPGMPRPEAIFRAIPSRPAKGLGGAMVDLLDMYRAGGFDLGGTELPDHLPVLLEYLSTRPLAEAQEVLQGAGHILVALGERLVRRDAAYAAVLEALVAIAEADPETEEVQTLLAVKDDDPEDLAALDAVWSEAQVTFGPDPNAGCPVSRDLLARMDPAAPAARAAS